MYNFILALILAAAMFVLGNAVGIDGVVSTYNKIVSLF